MAEYTTPNSIRNGSIVEVWNRSLGHFGGRFQVSATGPGGVRVRRVGEQTALPETFASDEVRLLPGEQSSSPRNRPGHSIGGDSGI